MNIGTFPRIPLLNPDILSNTCTFLTEYPDLLSVSLTCSTLRPIAVRSLLRDHPVILKRDSAIFKFHDFVFADAPGRLPHIIALEVDVPHDSATIATPLGWTALNALLAILRDALSLRSLTLWSSIHKRPLAYIGDPDVSDLVSALPSLRELTVSGVGNEVDFTKIIRSPLTKLTILGIVPMVSDNRSRRWSPGSLNATLSHVAASLESLTIDSSRALFDGPPESLPQPSPFCAMRSLSLSGLRDVPNLSVLLDLFPNLNGSLHLSSHSSIGLPRVDDVHDNTTVVRRRNGEAQEQRSWKHLKRVICDLGIFFILNPKCPISQVVIHSCTPGTTQKRCLAECLRKEPPARLNLQVLLSPDSKYFNGAIIPLEVASTLTHLVLCMCYKDDARYRLTPVSSMKWDIFFHDSLLPTIRLLRNLTHLRIVFHNEYWIQDQNFPHRLRGGQGASRKPSSAKLRSPSFDCAAAMSVLLAVRPSLRYWFLTTSSCIVDNGDYNSPPAKSHWKKSRAWRTSTPTDTGGEDARTRRELVELDDDVAEAIISKEGLELSEFEKNAMH